MTNSTPLDHARDLLALGFIPIPVQHRAKAPTVGGWQDCRFTAEDLSRYFGTEHSNVGVLLGEPSGWVVDVDIDDARALELADAFLPHTDMSWGRNSCPKSHRLYRVTRPVKSQTWKSPSGMIVELRATGRQTVAPGSTHESGENVRWDDKGTPATIDPVALVASLKALADAVRGKRQEPSPERLLSNQHWMLRSDGTSKYGAAALQSEVNQVVKTPEGARNDTLNRAAFKVGTLVGGGEIGQGEAERALKDAAQACGLNDREAAATIASGLNAGMAHPRGATSPDAVAAHDHTPSVVAAFNPINARDLIREYPTLRPVVIQGLLREGETMNVVAAPKAGKSWLVHSLAISVVAGKPWLGKQTAQGRVLLIDAELHRETLAKRLQATCQHLLLPETVLENLDVWSLRGERVTIDELAQRLNSVSPGTYRLILLDALYRFLPKDGEENANETMTQVYNCLDAIARTLQSSIAVVHHASKGNQSEKSVTDVGAGAGSQSRAADTHLILRAHEEEGAVVVDSVVRSFPPMVPFVIQSQHPGWVLADHLDPALLRKTGRRRRSNAEKMPVEPKRAWTSVTFATEVVGVEKLIKPDVFAKAKLRDIPRATAEDLLKLALEKGHVHRHVRGNEPHRFSIVPPEGGESAGVHVPGA